MNVLELRFPFEGGEACSCIYLHGKLFTNLWYVCDMESRSNEGVGFVLRSWSSYCKTCTYLDVLMFYSMNLGLVVEWT